MKTLCLPTLILLFLSLAGCTDLMLPATNPPSDESALLAAEGYGPAATQTHELERALTLAARREH
jgi:hypothetical protein